jgi:class 3 adenylate cyclase
MRTATGVSVLFSDLVGSTELAVGLGADEAEALRKLHFRLLRDAISAHGGREVKNLGDGVMATFPGAGAALDAAVAIQRSVHRHNRTRDVQLSLRVGVSTGDAMEEDGDVFGEPVVQAARLCAAARGGTILAAAVMRYLAPRGRHQFDDAGELQLKGLPEPVEAVTVVWRPEAEPDQALIPLQPRMVAPHSSGFVGRTPERALLDAASTSAAAGDRRIVLITGEAGVGKTRLVTEEARAAHEGGAVVLYGRCEEDIAIPYQPWAEALRHYVEHASEELLERHEPTRLAEVARLVPELVHRYPGLPPPVVSQGATEQHLLFSAVASLLRDIAADRLCVVVLDDLHWADRPTVQLLRHVAGTVESGALLVLATYRDTDVAPDQPLADALAGMRREVGIERVALEGLDDVEVLALLEATAGHELEADAVALAHAVQAETGGNPFFVGEVLRHLSESGAITRRSDGRWTAAVDLVDVGLPESIREVVGHRARRLGDEAFQVLGTAAVAGREFGLDVVAAASGVDEDDVLITLERAAQAGLVAEVSGAVDRFTFTHALVQHTLYKDHTESRRVRLHRRVAEAMEATAGPDPGERLGELAHHWLATTRPDDLDKAFHYACLAGRRAETALAPDEAVRWYRHALDALDRQPEVDDRRRCEILVVLGNAEREAGDPVYRDRLLEAADLAQRLGADDLLVAAALANNRGYQSNSGAVDRERVAVLERALDAVGDDDSPERARVLAVLAAELSFAEPERRVRTAEEAVAVARRTGDLATLVYALGRAGVAMLSPDLTVGRDERAEEAAASAEQLSDPAARFEAQTLRAFAAVPRGDLRGARRAVGEMAQLAEHTGQPLLRWQATYWESMLVLLAGDPDRAERLATEALQIGSESGQPDAMVIFGGQLASTRWHQGRLVEVIDLAEEAAADTPGLAALRTVVPWAHADAGNLARARELLDDLRRGGFELPWDVGWLTGTALLADATALVGDSLLAPVLYERLAPFDEQVTCTGIASEGPVAHYLGLLAGTLGWLDRADAHQRVALGLAEEMEAPFHIARAELALGALRRDRSKLQRALDVAQRHGYRRVEARAGEALEVLTRLGG